MEKRDKIVESKNIDFLEISVLMDYTSCKACFLQDRSSHHRCPIKKAVLKNFAIFKAKHLRWSLFFKNRLQHRCLPMNIAKFLRAAILKNIYERLSEAGRDRVAFVSTRKHKADLLSRFNCSSLYFYACQPQTHGDNLALANIW